MAAQEVAPDASPTVNIEFILDASGSMATQTDTGETRMDAAKRVLHEVIAAIPDRNGRVNVGLRVYGDQGDNSEATKEISCKASELKVPIKGVNRDALAKAVDDAQPTGWTPISRSLSRAGKDFPKDGKDIVNAVVLVTDGIETCGGDPGKTAGSLHRSGVKLVTNVVGLGTTAEEQQTLSGIAKNGGGLLLGAGNTTELRTALFEVLDKLQVVVGAGYVGGNAFTLLPAGDTGKISVIAYGPPDATTHQLPFIARNNSGDDIVGLKVSVTIRDNAGALLGAGNALQINPFFVRAGGVAIGYIYLGADTTFPSDADYVFKATSTPLKDARFQTRADLDVVEASLFENRIAGTVKNGFDKPVKGPFQFSAICLDQNGAVLSQASGYSDAGQLASGETQSFQIDLFLANYSGAGCPVFLVAGQGSGPSRLPQATVKPNSSGTSPVKATATPKPSAASSPPPEQSVVTGTPSGAASTDCGASLTAEQVVAALKAKGMPIGDSEVYTAETDTNHMLGRPNGYTSKANFYDTTLQPATATYDVVDGGAVEVFEKADLATNRLNYIQKLGAIDPTLIEYGFQQGGILLRLSGSLLPDQAQAYKQALTEVVSCK